MTSSVSPAALTHGHRRLLELATQLADSGEIGPEQFMRLLTAEAGQTDSEIIYRENKLTVHHYEPAEVAHRTPIFIVYALVNRPDILDLQPDRSVIRTLMDAGFDVYLLDWGEPSRLDTELTLSDYVGRYLDNSIDAVCSHAGVSGVHLMGYCMGGTLAIIYTALEDTQVRTLGLLATPVSFDGEGGILERWATHFDPALAADVLGNIPAELLAFEFAMMDPVENFVTKYIRLLENLDDDELIDTFARMERWVWDGVDVAGATFAEFVGEIYQENRLIANRFELDGQRVDLSTIDVPVLQIVGEHDHIVPPACSRPLHDAIDSTDDTLLTFPKGHIGISVSTDAHADLWPTVADWFGTRSAPASTDSSAPGSSLVRPSPDLEAAAQAAVDTASSQAAQAQTAPTAHTDGSGDVISVPGIGATFASRLEAAGIQTTEDLAELEPTELAAIAETTPGRAENWIEDVRS